MIDEENEVFFYINPEAKGHFTETDLIGEVGAISLFADYSHFDPGESQVFFKVSSKGYSLEFGFEKKVVYITRNDDRLELPLIPRYTEMLKLVNGSWRTFKEPLEFKITVVWKPTKLTITCTEIIYAIDVSSPADLSRKVLKRIPVPSSRCLEEKAARKTAREFYVSKKTRETRPPVALLESVRNNNIQPRLYEKRQDVYLAVTSLFQSVSDVFRTCNYVAFWDESNKGRRPKKEPKITSIIHSVIAPLARIRKLEVTYQHDEAGILDFHVSGILVDGERVGVCVECKNAHSKDLLHGLTSQLPDYMKQRECKYGIYCIFWFKGAYCAEPKEYSNIDDLILSLTLMTQETDLPNIRNLVIDFTSPTMPSKAHKEADTANGWQTKAPMYFVDYFGILPLTTSIGTI
jgi:hypothetical protein